MSDEAAAVVVEGGEQSMDETRPMQQGRVVALAGRGEVVMAQSPARDFRGSRALLSHRASILHNSHSSSSPPCSSSYAPSFRPRHSIRSAAQHCYAFSLLAMHEPPSADQNWVRNPLIPLGNALGGSLLTRVRDKPLLFETSRYLMSSDASNAGACL